MTTQQMTAPGGKMAQNQNQNQGQSAEKNPLIEMGRGFYKLLASFFNRSAIASERLAAALEQQNRLMEKQNEILTFMNSNLNLMTLPITPDQVAKSPYDKENIESFRNYDFTQLAVPGRTIGAERIERDSDGVSSFYYEGKKYTRRSNKSNTMGKAIWFSEYVGVGSDGKQKFRTIIKFTDKQRAEAAELERGLMQYGAAGNNNQ